MATVYIPAQLRKLTDGCETIEIEADNVGQVINALEARFAGIQSRLCQGEELSPSLQVSIDGVMTPRGVRAKLQPDSEVHFLPAIGGG